MSSFTVGYFVGSLARESLNRKLSRALVRLAPEGLSFTEIEYRELPLYSWDYDADYPPVARAFKEAIAAADAVLFVTPEYNRSIPGALKNAIDGRAGRTGRTPSPASPPRSSGPRRGRSAPPSASSTCAACSASATRRR